VKRVRVAVVDDSALVRKTVRRLLEADPRFEVVAQGANGAEALEIVSRLAPDVLTLDLDMPISGGLAILPRLVNEHRQRVLVLSTLTTMNAYPTFKALALGAIDFVTKPGAGAYLRNIEELGQELRGKLAAVASVPRARIGRRREQDASPSEPSHSAASRAPACDARPDLVVGVGGSTGSTAALEGIVRGLVCSLPAALVVVQHLPVGYSAAFAAYLAGQSAFAVKEAEEGEPLSAHTVYLAPGGSHLRIQRSGGGLCLRVDDVSPPLHGFRPAVDTLFYSLAIAARRRATGVLLSGMGGDGGHGLAAIRQLGGRTLAQEFEDCIVPEMPARAVALGGVERLLPAHRIAGALDRSGGRGEVAWVRAS
jgi:two-component system, chemotaxis family, protein-glutamate methylesterase/glutaminase